MISHYRIVSKIGAGGMGEVYLAQDTKLDRKVALKVLPGDIASDEERLLRFEREARAVSALNHPNIITIHEIGESAGAHFIATELIDGTTLDDRLANHSLTLSEMLAIAAQIARAIQAAHEAGIVHRSYLRLGKGAEAAVEFKKIIDRKGQADLLVSTLYPLATVGLARALALSGDAARARKAYEDFFALWRDADSELPILIEAKNEYAKTK